MEILIDCWILGNRISREGEKTVPSSRRTKGGRKRKEEMFNQHLEGAFRFRGHECFPRLPATSVSPARSFWNQVSLSNELASARERERRRVRRKRAGPQGAGLETVVRRSAHSHLMHNDCRADLPPLRPPFSGFFCSPARSQACPTRRRASLESLSPLTFLVICSLSIKCQQQQQQ